MFIFILYMCRTAMCQSSGEFTVSMRHLVYVTLCGRPSGMQVGTTGHRVATSASQRKPYEVYLSCMFISILYMFQATMCPSSGGLTVSMRYPVYVTLCRRPSGMHTRRSLHKVTYTRCRIDTINSPDDGHIAVRNM